MAGTPGSRTVLAAGLAFLAAAIGLATLGVALNTRSWDELEVVAGPPLNVGVALVARLFAVATSIVLLLAFAGERDRS
jgi:hypothetical protein